MKKFILHSVLWAVLLLGSFAAVFLSVDETSDPFYFKFTSPNQSSLILGSSIAGLAVNPSVLKEEGINFDIYNFAFAAPLSPYGPSYLRAIKRKLKPNTTGSVFIVTVDPQSISSDGENPNDTLYFEERNSFLGKLNSFSNGPNFKYLVHHYKDYNIKLLWNKSVAKLKDDGWLEVDIPESKWYKEHQMKDKAYKRKLELYNFSVTRFDYLKKIISYLKQHGEVYLVRLPKHEKYIAIENAYMPEFENKMEMISEQFHIPYLTMMPYASDFDYYDGVHVDKDSSREVSKLIAEFITKNQSQK